MLSESALRGIQVRRRLPRELFAGGSSTVALEIANTQQRVPAYAVVVEDRVRDTAGGETPAGRTFALRIGPRECETRAYRFGPSERGELEFTGFRVITRFPFGLFSKSLSLEAREEAVAFPEIEAALAPPNFGSARDGGERVSGGSRGCDATGLREFAPGDSNRHVHWRASVRRGELLVRELESEDAAEVEVRLRTAGVDSGEGFERRVSWAASEVVALLEADTRVSLRTDAALIAADAGARHRARLLTFLARVQPMSDAASEAS